MAWAVRLAPKPTLPEVAATIGLPMAAREHDKDSRSAGSGFDQVFGAGHGSRGRLPQTNDFRDLSFESRCREVLALIQRKPGRRADAIAIDLLGWPHNLTPELTRLAERGQAVEKQHGRWHPLEPLPASLRSELLAVIKSQPGIKTIALGEVMEMSAEGLQPLLSEFSRAGVITRRDDGGWHLAEA